MEILGTVVAVCNDVVCIVAVVVVPVEDHWLVWRSIEGGHTSQR
jgi:hypothetical protein